MFSTLREVRDTMVALQMEMQSIRAKMTALVNALGVEDESEKSDKPEKPPK